MEGVAGDGFEAFLERLQMDLASSPASSVQSSTTTHVSSHPPLPQSQSHSQTKYKGYPPSPTCSGSVEVSCSFRKAPNFSPDAGNILEKPSWRGTHRRAQSEITFRLPDQLMFDHEPGLDSSDLLTVSDETGEELLSAYLELGNSTPSIGLGLSATDCGHHHARSSSVDDVLVELDTIRSKSDWRGGNHASSHTRPPRHHHSMSMDGSTSITEDLLMRDLDLLETKKTMDSDKLAELSLLDPRRAKRILSNRQSAARSKERKVRYIADLEQKIHTLQTEATSLSAQVSILQRDTKGLSTENNELKLRLEAMEQQAHLHDALNETLKEEVQWLKSATVQMSAGNGHAFTVDTHHQAIKQPFLQMPPHLQSQLSMQMQQAQAAHSSSSNLPPFQPPAPADFSQHRQCMS